MDFLELAKKRYSCRSFKDEKIEKEKIDKILKAAQIAPSAANNQPWRILVLQEEESLEKLKKCCNFLFDAPCVFVLFSDLRDCWYHPFEDINSTYVDATIAATHMVLEATDLGLGSLMVMGFSPTFLLREFNAPAYLFPVMMLPIGYESEDSKPSNLHDLRKDIDEFTFYEHF